MCCKHVVMVLLKLSHFQLCVAASLCFDAFRYIFHFKISESVKFLRVNFETLNFKDLYDLFRWKFLMTIINRKAEILDFQYHMLLYI